MELILDMQAEEGESQQELDALITLAFIYKLKVKTEGGGKAERPFARVHGVIDPAVLHRILSEMQPDPKPESP
ncbi:hypothetical protein [Aureimonas sp. AU40]|uniref:hypothetical protein n=1 Tax=Aureimonas sp. AU40 TaxID=1637747 RepID=UPI000780EBC7|nr:hypothetical protein [Aureimonas sp. AU40]